jgi:hypothetical protein
VLTAEDGGQHRLAASAGQTSDTRRRDPASVPPA